MVFVLELVGYTETPVVLARIRSGRLAYIGDVNNEEETQKVTLAMRGLL